VGTQIYGSEFSQMAGLPNEISGAFLYY